MTDATAEMLLIGIVGLGTLVVTWLLLGSFVRPRCPRCLRQRITPGCKDKGGRDICEDCDFELKLTERAP